MTPPLAFGFIDDNSFYSLLWVLHVCWDRPTIVKISSTFLFSIDKSYRFYLLHM